MMIWYRSLTITSQVSVTGTTFLVIGSVILVVAVMVDLPCPTARILPVVVTMVTTLVLLLLQVMFAPVTVLGLPVSPSWRVTSALRVLSSSNIRSTVSPVLSSPL